jgi:hypothetical protein
VVDNSQLDILVSEGKIAQIEPEKSGEELD